MQTSLADNAIDILKATRDGEDLDPQHLKLVELAVNGMLSAAGLLLFDELLQQVRKGYVKPWFHGVEHMTRNHDGYVLWKGVAIEHMSSAYAASEQAADDVRDLARRCLLLEGKGVTPTTRAVVWQWPDL